MSNIILKTIDNYGPWILAPMAGVSEYGFRSIAQRMGASLVPTELISAKGMLYESKRSSRYLQKEASERGLWIQLFGGDPELMAKAALSAKERGAIALDINLGCPVKKVTNKGAGSGLLNNPDRVKHIITAMKEASGLPVTVKIRASWGSPVHGSVTPKDYDECLNLVEHIEKAGCDGLGVHARTRMMGYSGKADWGLIKAIVNQTSMPVFGNGDAFNPSLAKKMLKETGCKAVMIGRGALGNPWIFEQLQTGHVEKELSKRYALMIEHFNFTKELFLNAKDPEFSALCKFRQQWKWYFQYYKAIEHSECPDEDNDKGHHKDIVETEALLKKLYTSEQEKEVLALSEQIFLNDHYTIKEPDSIFFETKKALG